MNIGDYIANKEKSKVSIVCFDEDSGEILANVKILKCDRYEILKTKLFEKATERLLNELKFKNE